MRERAQANRNGLRADPCRFAVSAWVTQWSHPELTGRENVFINGAIVGTSHTRGASPMVIPSRETGDEDVCRTGRAV
jgi:hypothetical protein